MSRRKGWRSYGQGAPNRGSLTFRPAPKGFRCPECGGGVAIEVTKSGRFGGREVWRCIQCAWAKVYP